MISLRKNQQKKELLVMKPLYQNGQTIKSLKTYFSSYFVELTQPTATKVFLLFLAILSIQGIQSIRFLYHCFLKKISNSSLNSYYFLLSSGKIPLTALTQTTIQIALSCVPEKLHQYPFFLIIDDTLHPKCGTHFDDYQLMFDHAAHNGSNYLKGHCCVGLVLSIPIWHQGKVRYLSIPIRYRLRSEKENKLELAAEMIDQALQVVPSEKKIILLCDSWYPKGAVRKVVAKNTQLELISNVRVDTKLYDLPPKPTGKRGRLAKKGQVLTIQTDFELNNQTGDYVIGTRKVLTNLFPEPVYAMVTTSDPENPASCSLFISTLMPEDILMDEDELEKDFPEEITPNNRNLLPYHLYGFR